MKSFNLIITYFFILLTYNSSAQWEWQNPLPQGNTISGIHFVDANNGWAVAGNTIMKTTDGGLNWEILKSDITYGLNNIYFTDLMNGWAVGGQFTILHTCDGGHTWTQQLMVPGPRALYSVEFYSNQLGWAVGSAWSSIQVLRTADGGQTWDYQTLGSSGYNSTPDLCVTGQSEGWIVWDNFILHTTDGWDNWQMQNSNTNNALEAVHFIDSDHGWAVGNEGTVLFTSDGGVNWQESQDTSLQATYLKDVYFINSDTGWTTGYSDNEIKNGVILRTNDGGISWETQFASPEANAILCLTFENGSGGFAGGAYGEMLKALDGGDDWDKISSCITTCDFMDVFFVDEGNGWTAGGVNTQNDFIPSIFHTSDGGANWIEQDLPIFDNAYIYKLFFTDTQHGWALDRENLYQGDIHLLCTTDGGENWEIQSSGVIGEDIFFRNSTLGWRVGDGGIVQKTDDGGWNWIDQYAENNCTLNSLFFVNNDKGWIAGDSVILRTENAGETWEQQYKNGFWSDIFFIDEFHGWVVSPPMFYVGGKTMKTIDGGQTWEEIFDMGFYEVFFTDLENGWGFGKTTDSQGFFVNGFYCTYDGGYTWEIQSLPTSNIDGGFSFADADNGWAVGNDGTILHTDNGGIFTEIPKLEISNFSLQFINYPNPFSSNTTIEFSIAKSELVSLSVHDISGKLIEKIISKKLTSGKQQFEWNAAGLPAGIYFLKLETNDNIVTKKIILLD